MVVVQMNLKMETGEEIAIVENNYDDDEEEDEDEDQYLRSVLMTSCMCLARYLLYMRRIINNLLF